MSRPTPTAQPFDVRMRTVWYITPSVTCAGLDFISPTPPDVFTGGLPWLLSRIAGRLAADGRKEGLVLLDDPAAALLGLSTSPAAGDGHRALTQARSLGWDTGTIDPATDPMMSFWAAAKDDPRPTVHIGRMSALSEYGVRRWPWNTTGWPADTVASLQAWHALTGRAWSSAPPIMGLELMHEHLGAWRMRGTDGASNQYAIVLHDEGTPPEAGESVWTPDMWRGVNGATGGAEPVTWWHGYDRRRAGLTAAGSARLAAASLSRGFASGYDRTRAGWYLVSVPVWNDHRMPHPCGPVQPWSRTWLTHSTMDLVEDLAKEGTIDMPEIIDSLTAPGRPLLKSWAATLETAYQHPAQAGYDERDNRPIVQEAVKSAAIQGIGMLGKTDGCSSIWRPDWFHGINALKRVNGWRRAWQVGKYTEASGAARWPIAVDDDQWWYTSHLDDPIAACPDGFNIVDDKPGCYRVGGSHRIQ